MNPTGSAVVVEPGSPSTRPRWLWLFAPLALLVFGLGGVGGSFQAKLADVQKNDNSAFLPPSAESTEVDTEAAAFTPTSTIPGFLVYQRAGGLTDADRSKIATDVGRLRSLQGIEGTQVPTPTFAADGTAAATTVPLIAKTGTTTATGPELVAAEKRVTDVG